MDGVRWLAGTLILVGIAGCEAPPRMDAGDRPIALLADRGDPKAAKPPATPPAKPAAPDTGAVTPEMLAALKQLSAEDFQTRQEAVRKLQEAMAKHFQQMVLVQELMLRIQDNLATQLRAMTMEPEGEKAQRVASLMEFNNALSRWAIDVLALPDEQRDKLLKWGLSKDGITLVAKAYARKDEVRVSAAKELAKLDGEPALWMLAQLLNDTDREVSLMAMDAVWDKTPTPQLIEPLWNKAVAYAVNQYRPRTSRQKTVNVHGRVISVYEQDYTYNQRIQDADVAVDLLIKFKSPLVAEKLDAMFKEMASAIKDPNDYRWRMISPNYGEGGRALSRLMEAYRPKEALGFVYKVLNTTYQDGSSYNMGNNQQYWYSTRVDAAGLFVKLTNQDPDDYKLRKIANYNDRWMVQGTQKDEEALIKSLQAWWRQHWKEFGGEDPGPGPTRKPDEKAGAAAANPQPAEAAARAAAAAKDADAAKAAEEAKARAAEAVIQKPARVRIQRD